MYIRINGEVHKHSISKVEWSGDIKGSARKLQLIVLNSVKSQLGDVIELYNPQGYRLFMGRIFDITKSGGDKTYNITAFDNAIYLNKNYFVKNIYNKAPSEVLKEICGEIKIPVGRYPQDLDKYSYPAINNSGYETILKAYTLQHRKNGKIYSIVSEDGAIDVVEQGTYIENVVLDSNINIKSSSYSTSLENVINQIVLYKTEGNNLQIIQKIQDEESIQKYGVFQDVIQETQDNKNFLSPSQMLKTTDKKANLEVVGHNDLVSGYTVTVKEPHTQLNGVFLIGSDRHVWTGSEYSVSLELEFENLMNDIQLDEFEKNATKKKARTEKEEKIVLYDTDEMNKLEVNR